MRGFSGFIIAMYLEEEGRWEEEIERKIKLRFICVSSKKAVLDLMKI